MSFWLNKTELKKALTSKLFYKAFAGFWLTLLSIVILLLLFTYLQGSSLSIQTIKNRQLNNLIDIKQELKRNVEKKLSPLQQAIRNIKLSRGSLILLMHDNNEKTIEHNLKNHEFDLSILQNLDKQLAPSLIHTARYVALGPVDINLNDEQYLLFIVRPTPKLRVLFSLRMLPTWMKVVAIFIPSFILSILFTLYFILPLNSLSRSARSLAQGDLNNRAPEAPFRKDEVSQLISDFNFMADKLTHSIEAHKQLLADVSHELRTPLTRLNLANAMAQEYADETTTSYLTRVEKEAQCLDSMLADVLTLSRLEYTDHPLSLERISLPRLLSELLSNAEFEAQQLKKTLSNEVIPNVELECDANLLSSAIENITRNAIKYAETNIDFNIESEPNKIKIVIRDDGQGVDDALLTELGNAFYRTDNARDRQSGGIGLGLAIAKRAIIAHKGSVRFTNHAPHGLTVTITLPT